MAIITAQIVLSLYSEMLLRCVANYQNALP